MMPALGGVSYEFTELGLGDLATLSSLNAPLKEIADHFHVSERWLRDKLDNDDEARAVWLTAMSDLKQRLRKTQLVLSETNPAMAIHLGKHILGQTDKQEVNVNHTVHVVGTVPEFGGSLDTWKKQFAPKTGAEALAAPVAMPAIDVDFSEAGSAATDDSDDSDA